MKEDSIYKIFYAISIILLVLFVVMVDVDYLRYRMYSAPFYIYVIIRAVEFAIPSLIVFVLARIMKRKSSK